MKKKTRFIFYASLLFNFMAIVYFTPKIIRKLSPPESTEISESYWMQRDKYLNTLPIDKNSIVLIGTSLTHNFEIQETAGPTVKNRGINGDNLIGISNRLKNIIDAKPKRIILEAGINDIGDLKHSNDQIIDNFKELLRKIQNSTPDTDLFITSIFPVADSSERMKTYCSPETNTQISELNGKLEAIANDYNAQFLNFHKSFLHNNQLNPKYSMDGVHFSAEGYNLWQKLILPYLN